MTMEQAVRFLQENDGYLILTHKHPDGDTLGSAAGLCLGLRSLGKRAFVAPNPGTPERYKALVSELAPQDVGTFVTVAVDTAECSLFPEEFDPHPDNVALSIDHHPGGGAYAAHVLLDPEAAAAGELVYLLLRALNVTVTQQMAGPLYIAIVTDTGCLRFANTTPRTLRVTADLMDTGLQTGPIITELFERKTMSRFSLESELIADAEILGGGKICIMRLTQDKLKKTAATENDTDGIASLTRRITDVEIGVMLREEHDGTTRVSVRTGPGYDARGICRRMGGGGHARAAGCVVNSDIDGAREAVLEAIVFSIENTHKPHMPKGEL